MYHTESCIIKCSMYLCCADFKHFTVGWEMDLDLDISTLIISPTQPPLLMPVIKDLEDLQHFTIIVVLRTELLGAVNHHRA